MFNPESPILVYGATGTQGSPVAKQLLEAGQRIRVLVRDPNKAEELRRAGAEIAVGNFSDPASLAAAHEGVERVFLHLPLLFDFATFEQYGRNAIDAAREAGVKLLVFNTSGHAQDGAGIGTFQAKHNVSEYLRSSGVPYIILRPIMYLENLHGPWTKPALVEQGIFGYAHREDFKVAWACAADVGACAVAALNRPDLSGSSLLATGPEMVTGPEMAQRLTGALGKDVRFASIAPEDFEHGLRQIMGPAAATDIANELRWWGSQPHTPIEQPTAAEQLGVQLTPLDVWISQQDWK